MKIITISTFVGFCNRGAEALLKTRVESIRKLVPGAKFYVLSIYTETCGPINDLEYISTFGGRAEKLKSIKYLISSVWKGFSWTANALLFRLCGNCFNKDIKKIASSEIFVSTDGDTLGENYGFFPFLWRVYFLSLGIIMKKPIVLYAEGAGPFNSKIGKTISKIFFSRCAYISVRDKISLEYLVNLGIDKKRINLVADSAFLLQPSARSLSYRKDGKRLIGVAVSGLATKYGFPCKKGSDQYKSFIIYMAKLIDWIIKNLNAYVIMIPHVVQVTRNDYQAASDILKKVKDKDQVETLSKNLRAAEFKKAISYCDLVIASRMHAAIAALSTYVPIIGIAYSHKMSGVCNSLGVADLVIDVKDLDWKITNKIQKVLLRTDGIKTDLKLRIGLAKKLAEKPALEVAKILNKEEAPRQ